MSWTLLAESIDRLQWQDVADILLISFLAHRLILVFRGTSALGAIAALLGLRLIQGLAQEADLVLTTWLFEGLNTVLLLVVIVVFRNEIRDALVNTSPMRLFLGRPEHGDLTELRSMAEAAFDLAKTRTGALLVFRDRDNLSEHLRGGVRLNGHFSPAIIESIFARSSPVHDGAAILRNNRIERVGAFLPLTRRPALPQQYGTRHQAAIGLSEVSDAAVVVVSEERGEVSVVHRGVVELIDDPAALEASLRAHLLGHVDHEGGAASWRREVLTQAASFAAIVVSVATLWGIYSSREPSLTYISTRIDFRNVPETLDLQKPTDESVVIQVSGKSLLVNSLRSDQVVAFVDLHGSRPGYGQMVRLGPRNIEMPPGLKVEQITPPEIVLDLERRIEREIAVQPQVEGSPPEGFRIVDRLVRPEKIRVVGPESSVRLAEVLTGSFDLEGLGPTALEKSSDIGVTLTPSAIRLAPNQPDRVRMLVRIQPINPADPPPTEAPPTLVEPTPVPPPDPRR